MAKKKTAYTGGAAHRKASGQRAITVGVSPEVHELIRRAAIASADKFGSMSACVAEVLEQWARGVLAEKKEKH